MKRLAKWYPVLVVITIDQAFAFSNILLKKIVDDGINLWVFMTYRQSISAIFLSSLAFFLERNTGPKLTFTILGHLFVSAIIGASVTQYLFLLGIEYTSATFSSAFLNMVPVVTFLMALPFGLEKVDIKCSSGRAKLVGSLVCLGGAIVLLVYKGKSLFYFSSGTALENLKLGGKQRWGIGSVALLGGTLCWSSWYLLQTSIGKRYPCQYSSTAIMACFSALQSGALSWAIDRELSAWTLRTKSDIWIILYAGIVGTGLCFVGMSWCIKKRGPVFTAAFSPLVMIMAALYDIPILQEQLHVGSVIGAATVIAGLYILLWGKDKENEKQEGKTEEEKGQERPPELQNVQVLVESQGSVEQPA